MENGSFWYREHNSLDYDLMIESPPNIPAAQRAEERISVPGRDGVLRIDQGRYEPITVSYEMAFVPPGRRVEPLAREIKAWLLSGRGDYKLVDTYDKDYFRVASFSGPLDIENIFNWGARFTLDFLCNPYKYSHMGQYPLELSSASEITNPELFESLPRIRVIGSGRCELYLNNTTIKISDVSEYVDIDSEAKQVFKGTENMNPKTVMGEFPVLVPGENNFDWNSNVTSVEVIPRWRTL